MSDPLDLNALEGLLAGTSPTPWRLSRTKYGIADVLTAEHDMLAKGADLTDAEAIVALRNYADELIVLARRTKQAEAGGVFVPMAAYAQAIERADYAEAQIATLRAALAKIAADPGRHWTVLRDMARAALAEGTET